MNRPISAHSWPHEKTALQSRSEARAKIQREDFLNTGRVSEVANETEETRKKKATRRSPRGPQRGAQIDQRERSLDQRSVQGEPTLTSTRPLTVRFSRRSEPKTSARAVQYRENNSSRRDRELSEKKRERAHHHPITSGEGTRATPITGKISLKKKRNRVLC